jgi:hypothetical protein
MIGNKAFRTKHVAIYFMANDINQRSAERRQAMTSSQASL